jgi:hypothetical protein
MGRDLFPTEDSVFPSVVYVCPVPSCRLMRIPRMSGETEDESLAHYVSAHLSVVHGLVPREFADTSYARGRQDAAGAVERYRSEIAMTHLTRYEALTEAAKRAEGSR